MIKVENFKISYKGSKEMIMAEISGLLHDLYASETLNSDDLDKIVMLAKLTDEERKALVDENVTKALSELIKGLSNIDDEDFNKIMDDLEKRLKEKYGKD